VASDWNEKRPPDRAAVFVRHIVAGSEALR
jgi:hypothetical protein